MTKDLHKTSAIKGPDNCPKDHIFGAAVPQFKSIRHAMSQSKTFGWFLVGGGMKPAPHATDICQLTDGSFAVVTWCKSIEIWTYHQNLNSWEIKETVVHATGGTVLDMKAHPNGGFVFITDADPPTVFLWQKSVRTQIWHERAKIRGHTDEINCVACLPDGRIVSGSRDKTIRVWSPDPEQKGWKRFWDQTWHQQSVMEVHTYAKGPSDLACGDKGSILSADCDYHIIHWTEEGSEKRWVASSETDPVHWWILFATQATSDTFMKTRCTARAFSRINRKGDSFKSEEQIYPLRSSYFTVNVGLKDNSFVGLQSNYFESVIGVFRPFTFRPFVMLLMLSSIRPAKS